MILCLSAFSLKLSIHYCMDLTDQHIVWLKEKSTQMQPKQDTFHGMFA